MQEGHDEEKRGELIDRLRAADVTPSSAGTLAELSYRRAREALEKALAEARTVRLAALDDARATRERELSSLMASLKALRESAETEVSAILAQAELEASQVRDRARQEAESDRAKTEDEARIIRAEATALRSAAEERAREVERLEAEFNALAGHFAERVGLAPAPSQGWLKHLFGGKT